MSIKININNCNNISNGEISLEEGKLNIKYGVNGTGKSTIAKAINLYVTGQNIDSQLHTFGSSYEANVVFSSNSISSVEVFNEEFIENIVFDRSEVIRDSFNVFIKSPRYDDRVNKLNNRLKTLKVDIFDNEEIKRLMNSFREVSSKLTLTASGTVKRNPFFKSITEGKNFFDIPSELEKFAPFISENDKNVEWIDWKTKGHDFDEICGCPFCTNELPTNYSEEKETFSNTYKKATANNLKQMLEYFEALKEYIRQDKFDYLVKCIKVIEDTETIELEFQRFTQELNFLLNKFIQISIFDSFKVKQSDIGRLDEVIKEMYINPESIQIFNSEKTLGYIISINSNIKKIEDEIQSLKAEVGQIRAIVEATVRTYKEDINSFLASAGINYSIEIEVNGDNDAKTILKYIGNDNSEEVSLIKNHLSWGEKNAFALILFMFNALKKNPDLIILDDPISSFDTHKKYAIIHRLFDKNKESFYRKTVLVLTHDFEPIIDFIVSNKPTGGYVNANFIKNDSGNLKEKEITRKSGVDSYIRLLSNYSKNCNLNNVSRVVFLRQLVEHLHLDDKGFCAYNLLSGLIHGVRTPMIKPYVGPEREATPEEITKGITFIKQYMDKFDYDYFIENYFNEEYILQQYSNEECNYIKLQMFRAFLAISDKRRQFDDDIVLKFIDEVYHIENDYIYYLDVLSYDVVPDYIIAKCNKYFDSISLLKPAVEYVC